MSVFTCAGLAHPADEAGVKIETRLIENPFNKKPMTRIDRWTVVGAIRSDGTSGAMQTRINEMEAKYASGTSFAAASTATFVANGHTHTLPAGHFGGMRCVGFGWETGPWKMHTELSNRRGYFLVLQSETRLSSGVLGFKVQWQTVGTGGPLFKFLPSISGTPEKQQLQAATTIKQIHRGMIVHQTAQPTYPAAVLADLINDQSMVNYISPQRLDEGYGVEWRYVYERLAPVTETPSAGMFDPPA